MGILDRLLGKQQQAPASASDFENRPPAAPPPRPKTSPKKKVTSKSRLLKANVGDDWMTTGEAKSWPWALGIIVGESFKQDPLKSLVSESTGYVKKLVEVTMTREPENQYDSNAIRAEIQGQQVGYVAKEIAADMAPRMDTLGLTSVRHPGMIVGGKGKDHASEGYGVWVWTSRRLTEGVAIPDRIARGEAEGRSAP